MKKAIWSDNLDMKKSTLIISMIMLSSCNEAFMTENNLSPSASTICSGTTVLNVVGTADCSGGGSSSEPINMLSFASRKDNASFPMTAPDFAAFFATPPTRVVASLQDESEENLIFTDNHSVIPNPFNDSDGRYQMIDFNVNPIAASKEKKHYLETIAAAKMNNDIPASFTSRQNALSACGASGTIDSRISDCATLNGIWSFYDGKKYGQDGEGDWKLVSVVGAGPKFEVWRDERTKLLWSDKSSAIYNWYQAAGYSKLDAVSLAESEFLSSPGTTDPQLGAIIQPGTGAISVCPDVDAGQIAAGGGEPLHTYTNPETDFKAGLEHPQATWRLPSRSDWGLAEVNGIRKVLPNMDHYFWTTSSYSNYRYYAWYFYGNDGTQGYDYRTSTYSVRCVASSRD